jgi:hypothetical protein
MPKHSDGPPSGGRRYGGLEAFRSGLPPQAANPRRPRTHAELKAARNLADFTDHFGRLKSFDEPIPETQGVSRRRAASFKRRQELERERPLVKPVIIKRGKFKELWLVRDDEVSVWYRFVEKNFATRTIRRSLSLRGRERAMQIYEADRIMWEKPSPLP